MATPLALRKATTAAALLNKLYNPVRSVSAIPSVRRGFNTNSAQVSAYDDFNRSVDEDRRPDSTVSRRRENDYFSDVFDPISSTRSLSQILNMMDHMMDSPFMSAPRGLALGARRGWDAKEDDESLSLRFDMPGLDKDHVKISVEQNTLVVKGEAEKESAEDDEPARRYSTRLDLPMDVFKLNEINAEMKNGVLKIVVPKVKAEERKDVWQVEVK
ncbi:small heat shock protein, chloroplastic-like [Rutidosis leptorrhynchoides]|uniref:small heat shock protein, chloroplastic-like n=1 Tax=Rutidosis leptorrhynchoides TaxID=125765 RepID=UPI003A98E4A6